MSFGIPEGSKFNTAKNFDNWTNSPENYDKALKGEKIEEFQMFESSNLATYSSDLKQFSQDYINMWDSDGDGVWSKDEFIQMSTAGEGIPETIPEETQKAYAELFDALYENLNLDDNKDSISAGEFASYLYAADMDWENYAATGDVASSVDGKLDYVSYQGLSSIMEGDAGFEQLQFEKQDFYNYFYKEDEESTAVAQEQPPVTKENPTNEKPSGNAIEKASKDESQMVNSSDTAETLKKEIKASKADLPKDFTIGDDNKILDASGKEIGRVDISYIDKTNDGIKDKITQYFLYS